MTPAEISELYRRIALVTTRFVFTVPVEMSDLVTVRGALEEAVPDLFWGLRITARGVEVVGHADVDERGPAFPVYRREMLAVAL